MLPKCLCVGGVVILWCVVDAPSAQKVFGPKISHDC